MAHLYGGIEAGGTKFVCVAGTGPGDIRAEVRIDTTTPQRTLDEVIAFFRAQRKQLGPFKAIGIACFGPLDLKAGRITSTPKRGWRDTEIAKPVRQALRVPVAIDTDVNGAALGEGMWGAGKGLDTFLYLTVGTGIGGGVVVNGNPLHGLLHPEMGHLRIPHDGGFAGICPFHGDCLEGLACGPAIERRYGLPAEQLPRTHEAWDVEARNLSYALVNYIGTLSPQRIIMGGGVMQQGHLFPKIRKEVKRLLGRYIRATQLESGINHYIVPPALGNHAGVLGAIALAMRAS